jgi:hypothetical protein
LREIKFPLPPTPVGTNINWLINRRKTMAKNKRIILPDHNKDAVISDISDSIINRFDVEKIDVVIFPRWKKRSLVITVVQISKNKKDKSKAD